MMKIVKEYRKLQKIVENGEEAWPVYLSRTFS